jgi:hypothetical protein
MILVGLFIAVGHPQVLEAALNNQSTFTSTQLETCNENGGLYSPPTQSGVYFCLLPDGTLISCGGSVPGCTASSAAGPSGLSLLDQIALAGLAGARIEQKLNDFETKLDTIVETQEQIVESNEAVGDQISRLELICTTPDLVQLPPRVGTLVPLHSREPTTPTFCSRDDQGRLQVTVYNQGALVSIASTTCVRFDCGNPIDCSSAIVVEAVTGPLTSFGGSVDLLFNIPNACFDPTTNLCSFEVFVDAENLVVESNETNNVIAGVCGPQFF